MEHTNDASAPGKFGLQGKAALITGGTKNIGRATARAFAAAGADVVITARNQSGLDETRAELIALGARNVVTVAADILSDDDIVRSVGVALDAFGGIDTLVNNAYYSGRLGGPRPALETSVEQWDVIWRGNVLAPHRYAQLLEPTMRERGSGSIINVLSIAATGYVEGLMAYATSKNALATITRYLAVELAPAIRVNAISPGAVSADGKPTGAIQRDLMKLSPLQRVGAADEIASVAVFLASEASSFITGQVIAADGGVLARAFSSDSRV